MEKLYPVETRVALVEQAVITVKDMLVQHNKELEIARDNRASIREDMAAMKSDVAVLKTEVKNIGEAMDSNSAKLDNITAIISQVPGSNNGRGQMVKTASIGGGAAAVAVAIIEGIKQLVLVLK